jgi:pilus assembly protein Flp/PilA
MTASPDRAMVDGLALVSAEAGPMPLQDGRPCPTHGLHRRLLMLQIFQYIASLKPIKSERGVTAIEYGLIAALVAVVIITAVTAIGTNLSTVFTKVSTSI